MVNVSVGLFVTEDGKDVFHLRCGNRSVWLSKKLEKIRKPKNVDGLHIIDEVHTEDYVSIVSK